jgi:predicted acetyltransferase
VPATFLIVEVDGQLVGRTSIRHSLNPYLECWGGHIGYAVRPAFRRHGYATEILRQSLDVARSLGLRRALVVCANTNVRSAHIIERCGGEFENIVPGPEGEGPKRRYWIDLNGWLSLP